MSKTTIKKTVFVDIPKKNSLVGAADEVLASEMRYRRLFESACDGILILDASSRKIIDVNPFMIELLGYSRDQFLGKELWELGLLADEEASKAAFRELQDVGYIRYGDLRLETEHGRRCEVEFISNVYEEGDRPVVQCNIRDITGRKAAENKLDTLSEDLALAAEDYQHVLEHSLDVICQFDKIGNFVKVSQASEKVWGYTPKELIGTAYLDLVHPDDRVKTQHAIDNTLAGKPTSTFVNRNLCKDGSIATVMWSGTWSVEHDLMYCAARDLAEIRTAEAALQESVTNYRNLIEALPAIVYLAEPTFPYKAIYISPNVSMFGYSVEAWEKRPDMWISLIHPDDRDGVLSTAQSALDADRETELEYRIVARDGESHWVRDTGHFTTDADGIMSGWYRVLLNVTNTKELEERLRLAQRLEAVGLLAGGIAHDFNNMLTAIIGYSDITLKQMKDDDHFRSNIVEIKNAGVRAATVTNQLLAFSRQQILQPVVLSLNQTLADTTKMLKNLIGEDIEIVTILNPKVGQVKVDAGQLTQIILNLAVNARDAMPEGGKLTLETNNIFLDEAYIKLHPHVLPGAYVMFAVSDTGTGMSAETQRRIFEPFFTTKEIGRGTGLGLPTVYGIVQQSGGNLTVYSESGVGTCFKIYLPRVLDTAGAADFEDALEELVNGTETILMVEDDDMVRGLTLQILDACGYTVLEASCGRDALAICEKYDGRIDLLMTDVVMPEMSGRELAEKLEPVYPHMRVLFTSGYMDDAVVRHGVIAENANFIQKPFTMDTLARKIRQVLQQQ